MDYRVLLTADAEQDAEEIYRWLIKNSAGETGARWFHRLTKAIGSLEHFPRRCKRSSEYASFAEEVRELFYGNKPHVYRIVFAIDADVVTVPRLRHGRRDASASL